MKKKLKEVDLKEFIKEIKLHSEIDTYFTKQIEIDDTEKMATFLKYLKTISHYSQIDTIKGFQRVSTNLELDDIIHMADTSIACGIKVVPNPISRFSKWDSWDGGYIEGYARMDGFGEYSEFFAWFYIPMDKLEEILKKWQDFLFTF